MVDRNGVITVLFFVPSYCLMYTFQFAEDCKHLYYHIANIDHLHVQDPDSYFMQYVRTT